MGKIENETLMTLRNRRSCRSFDGKMIEPEELEAVVEAGTLAANGRGLQSPVIIAVTEKKLRDRLAAENAKIAGMKDGEDPFYGAPVILVVIADKNVPTHVYDGSLVIGNMLAAAESIGLGAIWIHRAKEEFESEFGRKLLDSLEITGDYEGIGHCALGYRKAEFKPATKKIKDGFVRYAK